jgi:hypothetical protein
LFDDMKVTIKAIEVHRHLSPTPNRPVEKVTFLKSASSPGSKIGNYFLSLKVVWTW